MFHIHKCFDVTENLECFSTSGSLSHQYTSDYETLYNLIFGFSFITLIRESTFLFIFHIFVLFYFLHTLLSPPPCLFNNNLRFLYLNTIIFIVICTMAQQTDAKKKFFFYLKIFDIWHYAQQTNFTSRISAP